MLFHGIKNALLLSLLLSLPCLSFATGAIYYTTKITGSDRYNTQGKRLTTIRAILRQDRYYAKQAGYFATKARRAVFDTASIWVANQQLKNEILYSKQPVWLSIKYDPNRNLFEIYQPD